MAPSKEESSNLPTREGRLVVALSKTLFERDIDGAFRLMGEFLDENDLQVSEEVIEEYRFAERIKPIRIEQIVFRPIRQQILRCH